MPVLASTSSKRHSVPFSVWSGQAGYPGAGRMPRYFSWINSSLRQILAAAVTPLIPHSLMQAFGKSFSQAVGEGLRHDRVVIVVRGPEPVAQLFQADSARHRECPDVIGQPGIIWRDEVCQ